MKAKTMNAKINSETRMRVYAMPAGSGAFAAVVCDDFGVLHVGTFSATDLDRLAGEIQVYVWTPAGYCQINRRRAS